MSCQLIASNDLKCIYKKHHLHKSCCFTICRILWKHFPWKPNACSNSARSSTVQSSGNGVKFGRSAFAFSMLCLCQNSIPSDYRHTHNRKVIHVCILDKTIQSGLFSAKLSRTCILIQRESRACIKNVLITQIFSKSQHNSRPSATWTTVTFIHLKLHKLELLLINRNF